MAKKILTVLIVALFCVLVGLLVLFFYLNKSTNPKNEVLAFIPSQTQFVLRLQQTSVTTNEFLNNSLVKDCFNLNKLQNHWKTIDSITSRNYKTAEVLAKNTSYICLDTLQHYLILIDLDKKANEQFIDQFLVGTTPTRRIEKFKEGYKAFYPEQNQPLYYFVYQNVFGISAHEPFLATALKHGLAQTVDPELREWEGRSKAAISAWGKRGAENKILDTYSSISFFGGWLDLLSTSFTVDVFPENDKISFVGHLNIDSLNPWVLGFSKKQMGLNLLFFDVDSSVSQTTLYNMWVKDSLGNKRPAVFQYHSFTDSAGKTVNLLVSPSAALITNFKNALDTSVQIIPMADERIKETFLINQGWCTRFLPYTPMPADTGKYFATIYNNQLFIANSTEFILRYAPTYPDENFIKIKTETKDLIFSARRVILQKAYRFQYRYQFTKSGGIDLSAEIRRK